MRPVKVGYFAQSSGINVAVQNDTELVFSNIQNNFMLLKWRTRYGSVFLFSKITKHPSYYLWGLKSAESNLHIFFESTEVENRTILRGRLKTIVTPTKTRFASWLFSISGMSKKLAVIPQLTTRLALLNTLRLTISFFSLMLNRYFFPFFLATWKRDAAKTRRKRRKYSWDKRNVHISAARGG